MECFAVLSDEIEGRIDPHFYRTEFKLIEEKLKQLVVKNLGEIASFQYGIGETAKNKGDIIYIRITDIDEYGNLKKQSLTYLEFIPEYKNYLLKKGDLLIARTGATYGKSYYFDENFRSVFAGYLIRIIFDKNSKLDSKYLYYFMQTKAYWIQAKQIMTGGGQPQFNANTIAKLKIPIPPKETQNKIVELMDNAYLSKKSKVKESQKLLDSINDYVLDELGINLPTLEDKMTYLVSSDNIKNTRADPMYHLPKYNKFFKYLKKSKFEIKLLKCISYEIFQGVGKNEFKQGIVLLKVKNIQKYKINYSNIEFIKEVPENKLLKNQDIISPFIGEAIKQIKFAVFDEREGKFTVDNNTGVIRLKTKLANPLFIVSLLNNQIGEIQIRRLLAGGGVPFIGAKYSGMIKIPLPPLSIQNRIAEEVKIRIQKAEQLKIEAKEELEKAKLEVERIILGSA